MLHILLYFLAIVSLSTAPVWAKYNLMPPEILGFYRLSIATILVGLYFFVFKRHKLPSMGRHYLWAIFAGFLFFLHLWTYKFAAKNTLVSNATILYALNPVWISVGAVLFFKENFSKRLGIAYVLSLLSIYVLVSDKIDFSANYQKGNYSAIISAFFYAGYMLVGKKARTSFSNSAFALIQYGICALCFLLSSVLTSASFGPYTTPTWIAVLGLVLIPTFLGHFTLTFLLQHMNMSIMGFGKLLEPIFSSVLAFYVFGEVLTAAAPASFGLTVVAIGIIFFPKIRDYFKTV